MFVAFNLQSASLVYWLRRISMFIHLKWHFDKTCRGTRMFAAVNVILDLIQLFFSSVTTCSVFNQKYFSWLFFSNLHTLSSPKTKVLSDFKWLKKKPHFCPVWSSASTDVCAQIGSFALLSRFLPLTPRDSDLRTSSESSESFFGYDA